MRRGGADSQPIADARDWAYHFAHIEHSPLSKALAKAHLGLERRVCNAARELDMRKASDVRTGQVGLALFADNQGVHEKV